MCYKGADELRQAILAGLFIYPGYQANLQQFAKKQLAEASQVAQMNPSELDTKEKSSQAPRGGSKQIKHFQKEVYLLNISDSPKFTKNDVKPPKKEAELETYSNSPDETN